MMLKNKMYLGKSKKRFSKRRKCKQDQIDENTVINFLAVANGDTRRSQKHSPIFLSLLDKLEEM